MPKTIAEINQKIKSQDALVLTAEEMISYVRENGLKKAAKDVDVVTTGTFGAMCSSGVFLNFGHCDPPMKMQNVLLNNVPAYGGIAAVDVFLGATQPSVWDENYGGAHVIEDLVCGRPIEVKAEAKGTDCYPKERLKTTVKLEDLNQAIMLNPRNAYQNYSAATNSTEDILHTYMGTLLPKFGNVTYSSAGQLSPLLNDPNLETIGIGTKVFLCGAQGYVVREGTQHNTEVERKNDVPTKAAGTLMLQGDLKQMDPRFLRAGIVHEYGPTLFVGVGIPIPVLNERIAKYTAVSDEDIEVNVLDYGIKKRDRPVVRKANYKELRSGRIELNGQEVPTSSLSSYKKAREVAHALKKRMEKGGFLLSEPVARLPKSRVMPMNETAKRVLVCEIMKNAVTCDVKESIADVSRIMLKRAVNHIPVLECGKLAGIVTSWDVAKSVATGSDDLQKIMVKHVITVHPGDYVEEAARKLNVHKISALPVVDSENKLVGIITSEDISKLMSQQK